VLTSDPAFGAETFGELAADHAGAADYHDMHAMFLVPVRRAS
jgi:hypothetical protein